MNDEYKNRLEAISKEHDIPVEFLDRACKSSRIMTALDGWLEEHFDAFVSCAPPNSEYIIGVAETNRGCTRQLSFGVHYVRTGDDASKIEKKYKISVIRQIHPVTISPG